MVLLQPCQLVTCEILLFWRLHYDGLRRVHKIFSFKFLLPLLLACAEGHHPDARNSSPWIMLVHGPTDEVHNSTICSPSDDPATGLFGSPDKALTEVRLHNRVQIHVICPTHDGEQESRAIQEPHVCMLKHHLAEEVRFAVGSHNTEPGHEAVRKLDVSKLGLQGCVRLRSGQGIGALDLGKAASTKGALITSSIDAAATFLLGTVLHLRSSQGSCNNSSESLSRFAGLRPC
mmetsp:Transcript_51012/g.108368  ORF Transcript_51012/g.108368 Transcript_51012/m.108368 type:complete len:232 (+) Transcript_51012:3099-3794(+)